MGPQRVRRKGRRLLWIGVPVLLIGSGAVFLVPRLLPRSPAPECGASNAVLTVAPTGDDGFQSLLPLGSLFPPDHTIPTDHTYYVFARSSPRDPVPVTDVRAPGTVWVTRITFVSAVEDGRTISADYKLDFSPCKQIHLYYDHITKLAPRLQSEYGAGSSGCQESHSRPGSTNSYCSRDVGVKLSAGELVGQAGGGTAVGFDFGGSDSRRAELRYANSARYNGESRHVICPFDLFQPLLREALMRRFERSAEPRCGRVMQDKPGAAQGNWFFGDGGAGDPTEWGRSLALVHDNRDPTLGVVSVGGVISEPGTFVFTPTHTGLVNREFAEIRPGAAVYCYEYEGQGAAGRVTLHGHVLVRLVSATELRAEHHDGDCPANPRLAGPTSYDR